jgi:hypothetical protein
LPRGGNVLELGVHDHLSAGSLDLAVLDPSAEVRDGLAGSVEVVEDDETCKVKGGKGRGQQEARGSDRCHGELTLDVQSVVDDLETETRNGVQYQPIELDLALDSPLASS